ncbi:tRNA (adenine(58)-N(1))-methyltransferase catalytic subunit trm61 [Talaromyces atroroseus]|uniref:tRNA (adenine(58)-N(1))-methyltransferase catalytic subunit TRM61 n=1 Tax=Talaromyces atroroseus TaxID=1441469 RepID=A0A225BCM3_TALAT|nr:tRNA (adenine(58)-N(1))-methyltransferase catalytic subunit trm61 [Talaromyces atroroseus]OKL64675.1 tRNA (adenine(58)-N(1))-methyltransferase catalytic subunit trm61 [Talaromyces atroroseus]
MPSPFLNPGASSAADQLAILHLRRDNLVPAILKTHDDENRGYNEGKVENNRFGSFPHSTLIDKPWGSQIAASHVDTAKRGRAMRGSKAQKRKAAVLEEGNGEAGDQEDSQNAATNPDDSASATPKAAPSGFIHILPPTPESWTSGLPHRTQVVYTPDYSYILQRLRVWPGKTIIEAGAGSGSFTHAAARAVFNGYQPAHKKQRLGQVCSFEFHETRAGKIQAEVKDHGLEDVVKVTHRDVYNDGFLLGDPKTGQSPKANAIFLDLPAPWLALKHLVRDPEDGSASPLDPSSPVHLCTFSPCIEQVQQTIKTMRQLGWLSISMVEVVHRRLEVRREVIGLDTEGIPRAAVFPKSVDEALGKLRVVEKRMREYRKIQKEAQSAEGGIVDGAADKENGKVNEDDITTKTDGSVESQSSTVKRKETDRTTPIYELGRLIHRTEQDLKTHTSYLVFSVLPRSWSEEDERKQRELWPSRSTK